LVKVSWRSQRALILDQISETKKENRVKGESEAGRREEAGQQPGGGQHWE
jgi:hypothetical protein